MTGVTPNLRLNLPTYDQPGWDTLLQANWQIIDSILVRVSVAGYVGVYTAGNAYILNQVVTDPADSSLWQAQSGFTTLSTNTFAQERAANTSHWVNVTTSTNNASASANNAAGSATAAATSATNASTSATNAANSATNAATSATNAANSVTSAQNTFKNKFINPQFNIFTYAGVGANVTTTGGLVYAVDGWQLNAAGAGSLTGNVVATTDAQRASIGDEAQQYNFQAASSGTLGVNDYTIVSQNIEGLRQFTGKTIVLGFWASASVASSVGIEFVLNFGTGGSPSATVTGLCQQKIALTTGLAYYTTTPFTVPSAAGKTFGTTAGTDYLGVNIWLAAGTTISASRGSNIGAQPAWTLSLFNPQLEIGSTATLFEKRLYQVDLFLAQRYYQKHGVNLLQNAYTASVNVSSILALNAPMRISPTITSTGVTLTNTPALQTQLQSPTSLLLYAASTAAGTVQALATIALDARL